MRMDEMNNNNNKKPEDPFGDSLREGNFLEQT